MAFGRSLFVSGANRGIGLELVTQLVRHQSRPEFIFAACRSPDNAVVSEKCSFGQIPVTLYQGRTGWSGNLGYRGMCSLGLPPNGLT